jgi:hypothetical protein
MMIPSPSSSRPLRLHLPWFYRESREPLNRVAKVMPNGYKQYVGFYIHGTWTPGEPYTGWVFPRGWHWMRFVTRRHS